MSKVWGVLSILALALAFAPAYKASTTHPGSVYPAWQDSEQQILNGELVKVDTDHRTFTIKAEGGDEIQFEYTTDTKVEGSQNGIQGLSSDTGTKVSVRYEEKSGKRIATRIEILKGDG